MLPLLAAWDAVGYSAGRLAPPPAGGESFVQVGSDGGLLEATVSHEWIPVAPAERFDVVIDFSKYRVGSEITLKNRIGEGSTAQVMRFHVVCTEKDDSMVPGRLAEVEKLDPDSATETRRFRFERGDMRGHRGWVVDEEPFHPDRISARSGLARKE